MYHYFEKMPKISTYSDTYIFIKEGEREKERENHLRRKHRYVLYIDILLINRCPAEAGLQVKVEGTATSDAVCENATDVPSSGESTSPPPVDKDKNVTHPIEPGSCIYIR